MKTWCSLRGDKDIAYIILSSPRTNENIHSQTQWSQGGYVRYLVFNDMWNFRFASLPRIKIFEMSKQDMWYIYSDLLTTEETNEHFISIILRKLTRIKGRKKPLFSYTKKHKYYFD